MDATLTPKEIRQLERICPPKIGTVNRARTMVVIRDGVWTCFDPSGWHKEPNPLPDPFCPAWQGAMFAHVSQARELFVKPEVFGCSMSVWAWSPNNVLGEGAGETSQEALCRLVLDIARRSGKLQDD